MKKRKKSAEVLCLVEWCPQSSSQDDLVIMGKYFNNENYYLTLTYVSEMKEAVKYYFYQANNIKRIWMVLCQSLLLKKSSVDTVQKKTNTRKAPTKCTLKASVYPECLNEDKVYFIRSW